MREANQPDLQTGPDRSTWRSAGGLEWLLVLIQLAGVGMACWPVGWINRGSAWALLICLAGTLAGLWTLWHNPVGNFSIFPRPRRQARLIQSGPYRWVRHPMYSSLMIMMLGVTLFNGHWLNVLGLAMVVFAVISKARLEETFMAQRFPNYQGYAQGLPRFLPGMPPASLAGPN